MVLRDGDVITEVSNATLDSAISNAALDMSVSRDDNVTTEISGAAHESDVATAADISAPSVNGISVLCDGDVTTAVSNVTFDSAM